MAIVDRTYYSAVLFIAAACLLASCGLSAAGTSCGCAPPDRFHGAEGIDIPPGPNEPSWWIDPVIEDSEDEEAQPEAGPATIRATVPADTLFEVGSSEITRAAEAALEGVHASLNGGVILAATLDCHADSTGDTVSNQTLSEERAANLSAWMATHWDVPEDQITARGHGETQPIATNDTPTGRSQNRRCEISLTVDRPT
jgi:outer membrane protein OmpA-like peptidoglycan-associated protein